MNSKIRIHLPDVIGKGYASFWHDKHRYRVLKGGRGSKKSATTALWFIWHIMKHPEANAVCVRKTFNTHKDSTFAQLKWAARRLNVYEYWRFTVSPLEATYIPTGQKILFRGFDDVLKLTSITVDTGSLCWAWLEEAYEIDSEDDFTTLNESIRGEQPPGLWKQITLTFNPWINTHWTKTRFFDNEDPDAFTLTTTYKCNEFLDDADRRLIEQLEHTDPERFAVVGLGEYGMPGGAYFDEFRRDIHVVKPFVIPSHWTRYRALDYGLDMLACIWFAVDPQNNVYAYKELHESNHIISQAAKRIVEVNGDDRITQTYAPGDLWNRRQDTGKSAAEIFGENGVSFYKSSQNRIQGWYSIKEAINVIESQDEQTGTSIKTAKLRIFNNCSRLIANLPQIQQSERDPNDCANEPHDITHICDALRYFCVMRFNKFKATEPEQDPDKWSHDKQVHKTYASGRNASKLASWG